MSEKRNGSAVTQDKQNDSAEFNEQMNELKPCIMIRDWSDSNTKAQVDTHPQSQQMVEAEEVLQQNEEMTTLLEKLKSVTKILLVDDNPLNLFGLQALLSNKKNLAIDLAYNGQEAIQKIKDDALQKEDQPKYQIVFLDINMPVMNGFDAARSIQTMK